MTDTDCYRLQVNPRLALVVDESLCIVAEVSTGMAGASYAPPARVTISNVGELIDGLREVQGYAQGARSRADAHRPLDPPHPAANTLAPARHPLTSVLPPPQLP